MNKMRVGFYVRNSFQVNHFRSLFGKTPNAVWVVKSKSKAQALGILDGKIIDTSQWRTRLFETSVTVAENFRNAIGVFDTQK